MRTYAEIAPADEAREVHPGVREHAERVLRIVAAELGLRGATLRWFREGEAEVGRAFQASEEIDGACGNRLGAHTTLLIRAGFDPRSNGSMGDLTEIIAHEAYHSAQVSRLGRAAGLDEMARREADAYAFARDAVRRIHWRAYRPAEPSSPQEDSDMAGETTTTLETLSNGELDRRLKAVDAAIEAASVEVTVAEAELRAAQAVHSKAEQATALVGSALVIGRDALVVTGRERAVEARDRGTAAEVAAAEIARVESEYAESAAKRTASRARDRLRELRRTREHLQHGWGGRDWRERQKREKERAKVS